MTPLRILFGAALLCWAWGLPATAAVTPRLAEKGCGVLAARVDAEPGGGPVFLPSFDSEAGFGPTQTPALATAAFTYDNALAIIALLACDHEPQARRLGEALLLAATHDRAGAQGRLRNAYRSGPQEDPPLPNGWWDPAREEWLEDDYQVGTATGNVAWAALALLTLAERSGEPRFHAAATSLALWVVAHTADHRGAGGFTGGIFGGEANARPLTWKSTEHNLDLLAVFRWLAKDRTIINWTAQAEAARTFVDAQWDAPTGHFLTGTTPDGVTANRATSGLDAQLWPLLLPEAPAQWRRALDYAEQAHGVAGGFSFNDDRNGLWVEGTAQAALTFRAVADPAKSDRYLHELAGEFSPGGYLWATPQARLTTGLAIGPGSTTADFFYYHQPHLGATAWMVIAASAWNPFTGHRLTP